jgi:hypothetical protein
MAFKVVLRRLPAAWVQIRMIRRQGLMSDKHVHKHDHQPSDISLRVKAVESLLVEKGLLDPAAIDKLVDA